MVKKPLFLFVALMAMMVTALVSQGRVFFRWGAAAQSLHALEALGGTLVYEAPVSINGGKGQLTVFSFEKRIDDVAGELTRAFGMTGYHYAGGTMGYGSVSANGQTRTLVAIQLGEPLRTIVFHTEQSDEESRRSASPPTGPLLTDIPEFPGSTPVFSARDENAGMGMAISRTQTGEAEVRQALDMALAGEGWKSAFPTAGGTAPNSSLKVYLKQQQVCCVLVDASERQGETRITILHKRRGMK